MSRGLERDNPRALWARMVGMIEPRAANTRPGEPPRATPHRIEAWLIRRAATARRLGITREGLYNYTPR